MSHPTASSADTFRADARRGYDAFAARGVKLNLTRGKPSSRQLDLSNELLSLPGEAGLQGRRHRLPQLRRPAGPARTAGAAGARSSASPADRVILGNNASLSLMHDAVVFALLKGTVRQRPALVEGTARRVSLPRARLRPPFRHLRGLRNRDDSRCR